jgi:hypothetical protein
MTLIGLTGPAGAGKDTVAAFLVRDYDFVTMSFASPIKDALVSMFGLDRDAFTGTAKEAPIDWIGKSPRQLMQTLGTEWGRHLVREDLWLRHAQRRLQYYQQISGRVVITDVRFENEAAWLRSRGGRVWHIARTDRAGVNPHTSEAGVQFNAEAGDDLIDNNHGLEQLADEIRHALRLASVTPIR